MGRRPLPEHVHKARGTYRADRHGGGVPRPPSDKVSRPPAWLSEGAKRFWRKLAPQLRPLGLLANLDLGAFTILCVTYDAWVQASLKLRETGETYRNGDAGGIEKRHPLLAVVSAYREGFIRLALEFGMTPASRQRLRGIEPPDLDDPEVSIFDGDAL